MNVELPDDLAAVRELLVGHTVRYVDDATLALDDGRVLTVEGNVGCGGCSAGNYDAHVLNDCPVNAIMDVELVTEETEPPWDGPTTYRLFVLAQDERIEVVRSTGDDGNGYYGTGFYVHVRAPR